MADELDDVFSGGAMADAPEPGPEIVPDPEPVVEEPQGEPQPEPQPEVETEKPEKGFVPLAAVLDERDRRKAAEKRAQELERQYAQQAPQEVPDALDDPIGLAAWQRAQINQLKLEMSYEMAAEKHGAEKAEAARVWAMEKANGDPAFEAQLSIALQSQRNPMNWIVQQHKREALLSDIGDNPDDWFTREAAKRGYVMPSATASAAVADVVPKQASVPARAPRSLASQGSSPSDIRHVPTGPLAGVDAVFS
jgi:hypothetical protein